MQAIKRLIGVGLLCCGAVNLTSAATVQVVVQDNSGAVLPDAVVYAEPLAVAVVKPAKPIEIEQRKRQFSPLVSVLQTGSSVIFPNHDTVLHHVYSFSPAKSFELKLYSGVPSKPVVFDKAGTVVLGCNIHDQMVAYIQVVDTPYFAKTNAAGQAQLTGLTAGSYKLKAWHYTMLNGAAPPERTIEIKAEDVNERHELFKLPIKAGAN